jgi:hypothetical protein
LGHRGHEELSAEELECRTGKLHAAFVCRHVAGWATTPP